jgi:ribonuclease P protein component
MKMKDYTSLKKNIDFQKVYKEGKSKANKYLVMYVLPNDLGINRLGISVSKKVGNSVVRHHLTRLIRESYRLNSNMFNSSLDIVVVVRTTARDENYPFNPPLRNWIVSSFMEMIASQYPSYCKI